MAIRLSSPAVPSVLGEDTTQTGASPSLLLVDDTAAGNDFLMILDTDKVNLRDNAQADGTLIVLDIENNQVGIGTTTPAAKLDIVGVGAVPNTSGAGNSILRVHGAAGYANFLFGGYAGTPNYIGWLQVSNDTTAQDLAINPLGGKVGIGTSAPSNALDIVGDVRLRRTAAANSSLIIGVTDIANADAQFVNDGATFDLNVGLFTDTLSVNRTTGAVTFNELGADQDFRVEGDTNPNLFFVDASADRIGVRTATPQGLLDLNGGNGSSGTDAILYSSFSNAGITQRFTLDNTDNTNAASSASLYLGTGGASGGDPFIQFNNRVQNWVIGMDNSDSDKFKLSYNTTLGTNDYLTVDGSGNVGIGTTPTVRFQVLGDSSGNIMTMKSAIVNAHSLRFQSAASSVYIDNEQQGAITFRTDSSVEKMTILNSGQVSLNTVGKGLSIAEGANAKMGTSALVAGSVVVSTTAVTATSRIMLTPQDGTLNAGSVWVSARTAGTSFTITSTNALDARTVAWVMFEPS